MIEPREHPEAAVRDEKMHHATGLDDGMRLTADHRADVQAGVPPLPDTDVAVTGDAVRRTPFATDLHDSSAICSPGADGRVGASVSLSGSRPSVRVAAAARVFAELVAWALDWKWYEDWRQDKDHVGTEGHTWATLSVERRSGRLRRTPRNEEEACAWGMITCGLEDDHE